MVLINQFGDFFDRMTVANAFFVPGNPYEFVGTDSDIENRQEDISFAYNFFRLGEQSTELSSTAVQRRIVLVDGSTSELLFSFTPTGDNPPEVVPQINARVDEIFEAINSVGFAPTVVPAPTDIAVGGVSVEGSDFVIDFSSAAGETNFRIMTSDLESEEFVDDVTALATVNEVTPGNYRATIDISLLGNSAFFRIEL